MKLEYKGKTCYFCSESCKEVFEKDPKRFVDRDSGDEEKILAVAVRLKNL